MISLLNGLEASIELLAPESLPESSGGENHRKVLLPGSFNPLHQGHMEMARLAAERPGYTVWYELSCVNADKPAIHTRETKRRLVNTILDKNEKASAGPSPTFRPHGLLITRLPTFVTKARFFPECFFAVGADTLVRVADPRFYENSVVARDRAIAEITSLGCRFLVFGRLTDRRFRELHHLRLPDLLFDLCEEVPEHDFRYDISSRDIRRD